MRGKDQIYTPDVVAAALAQARNAEPALVADFAAGEGALLAASARRWPNATHVALDIDGQVAASLRQAHPDWRVHQGDFLAGPAEICDLVGAVDLVLLNPPFSCRGNAVVPTEVAGLSVRCSRAMAFVCEALRFLSEDGELVALIPASCLTSAKDQSARDAVGRCYGVEVLQANQPSLFEGHAVAVAQIRIARRLTTTNAWGPPPATAEVRRLHAHYRVLVARGSLSMHEVPAGAAGAPLVHTTDLQAGLWRPSGRTSGKAAEIAQGQAVLLLPRVGRPDPGKLALVEGPAVLSDCLFRLRTEPAGHEAELLKVLTDAWPALTTIYAGSCAPYATLARLAAFLASLGVEAAVEPRLRRIPKIGNEGQGELLVPRPAACALAATGNRSR